MSDSLFQKITINCVPGRYSAWPDVALAGDGRLVCVFTECEHHTDRSRSQIMLIDSHDRGSTWSNKRPLTEMSGHLPYYYNCARIVRLPDGRLCITVDRVPATGERNGGDAKSQVVLFFSDDHGATWSRPVELPVRGIVPDKLTVLDTGRYLITTHYAADASTMTVVTHFSDDGGVTWSPEITVARKPGMRLCEASLLPLGNGVIAAFMRENSMQGLDCQKALSFDNGQTWGEVTPFPLPGCHRPVAGLLKDGRLMVTYRFAHGAGDFGMFTQNFFCAVADRENVLKTSRSEIHVRIIPVDYDRSAKSDTGYSGWVEFEDGEMFIVNYIVDDARDHGQIRGYRFNLKQLILS